VTSPRLKAAPISTSKLPPRPKPAPAPPPLGPFNQMIENSNENTL